MKKCGVFMFSTIREAEAFFNERKKIGIKPGLDRMRTLLHRLDNPEDKLKAIHLAGTNGKGSTLHFLKAALVANHYEVGVFTSPSFTGLTGHIYLNNRPISEEDFLLHLNRMYPIILEMDNQRMAPSEFEIITAIAFNYFANHGEIILVETGMGGRFDTTNCLSPILSIITNVSLDHTDYLGDSLEEIAYHKAGIIKKNTPVIIGKVKEEARAVLLKEANQLHAPTHLLEKDFFYKLAETENTLRWKNRTGEYLLHLKVKGEYQKHNVSLALQALEVLMEHDYLLDWKKAITGIEALQLMGRFELVQEEPKVIVDAAHNEAGIKAFIETVEKEYPEEEKEIIIAMFQDKEVHTMLRLLLDYFNNVTLTTFDHPRAWNPYQLPLALRKEVKRIEPDYRKVLQRPLNKERVYFITGSLHFITLVRKEFRGESGIL
jgi:dihydrofolate synthase/folylpolyglutamate synthase